MRIRFVALSLVLAVVAGCTSTPIPDSFDWCYTYDFREPVGYVNLIDGEWIDGAGIRTVDNLMRFSWQHIRIVEPTLVLVRASRAPDVTGDIAIAAAGEVFSVVAAFNNTMPGDMVDVELPFIPETLGTGSSVVNITLEAAQPVDLLEIEVRGIGLSPFDRNECGPQLPTPTTTATPYISPTPTDTPEISPTPSNTPPITATMAPTPSIVSNCTPHIDADWCVIVLSGGYTFEQVSHLIDYSLVVDNGGNLPSIIDNTVIDYGVQSSQARVKIWPQPGVTITHIRARLNRFVWSALYSPVARVAVNTGRSSAVGTQVTSLFYYAGYEAQRETTTMPVSDPGAGNAWYFESNGAGRSTDNTWGRVTWIQLHGVGTLPQPVEPTPPAATATSTPTPSRTSLPTLVPSSTIPATATQLSLFSPTPPPTNTPAPSATPRNTNTPWPSPTFIPSPTLFMTSTFVPTNTPAPGTVTPGGETHTPIPDLTPGGDDGEQEADDTGQAQLDVLWLILNLLSQFFNWIANVIGTFFAWLGQLFALIVGIFEAIISLIAAIIGLIIKLLEWLFNAIGLILSILWLLVQIIFRVIFLVAAWLGLVITRLAAIFNGIINAQPVPIPGLPLCETAPLQSDLCAIYYILDWTLFAPATPGESIITVAIGLTVLSIIFFVIYRLIRLTKTGSKGGFSC